MERNPLHPDGAQHFALVVSARTSTTNRLLTRYVRLHPHAPRYVQRARPPGRMHADLEGGVQRQVNGEDTALIYGAGDTDAATVRLGHGTHQGQA